MTAETTQAPEFQKFSLREYPQGVQHGVQARHIVSLGGEIDVPVGIIGAELRHVHLVVVQVDHDIHGTEAGPQVPGTGNLDRRQRVRATHVGDERQHLRRLHAAVSDPFEFRQRNDLHSRHPERPPMGSVLPVGDRPVPPAQALPRVSSRIPCSCRILRIPR